MATEIDMPGFSSVRAVLFDAVGTLIHPQPPVAEVYHLAGWSHGSQLAAAEIKRRFQAVFARREHLSPSLTTNEATERIFWRELIAEVFSEVPQAHDALFDDLWQHFAQPEHWRLFADVPAVWRELQARGYLVGIASNFDQRLKDILRGHPPLDRCETLFVSSLLGHRKPAREFFAAVEDRLQLSGAEILLVGDDETNDVNGARAAGWEAIQLRREAQGKAQGDITTLVDLLELLPRVEHLAH